MSRKPRIEFKDILNFEVYGYAIMDNHYHIVIRTREIYISSINEHKTSNAKIKKDRQSLDDILCEVVNNDAELFNLING